MPVVNSTSIPRPRKAKKPKKPFPDYPLFAHASGRWCRKVRGKFYYFGTWDDPSGALDRWNESKADILAGRKPRATRVKAGECTLRDLVNQFLTFKKSLVATGELSPHSFADYYRTCESLIDTIGADVFVADLGPADFGAVREQWAGRLGLVRLGNEINRTKILFRFALEEELIEKPIRYGQRFERPDPKNIELAKQKKGKRLFTAEELRRIISAARQPFKAMALLAVNTGIGNSDAARMPIGAVDLKGGWLNYPRQKTGVERRCKLWPETVAAIREWLKMRPEAKHAEHTDLLFLSSTGETWYRETADNPISREFGLILRRLKITGNKGFYAARHTFATVAGETLDQAAVNQCMGHKDTSMPGKYRQTISDARLANVAAHVRRWLYGKKGGAA